MLLVDSLRGSFHYAIFVSLRGGLTIRRKQTGARGLPARVGTSQGRDEALLILQGACARVSARK